MTALDDFKRLSGKLFIEGGLVASQSSQRLPVIDPATEDKVGEIADGGRPAASTVAGSSSRRC